MAVCILQLPDQGRGGMKWGREKGAASNETGDVPGGPVVKTSCCQCRRPTLVEKLRSHMLYSTAKRVKTKNYYFFKN